jgi:hypothetical protein
MADTEEIANLRTRLAEAKAALHALVTGDKPEEVSFGENRRTKWTPARIPDLERYISKLENELSALTTGTSRRRPIYPMGAPR